MPLRVRLLALLLLAGCPAADEPGPPALIDLTVSIPAPADGYQMVTEASVVPPGTEVERCSVVRVEPEGDEGLVWLTKMEARSSDGSHHMNVLGGEFSFLDAFLGDGAAEEAVGAPAGTYDCAELGDLMTRANVIFPSQRPHQWITFPERVGVPFLTPLVFVFHHHYVNTTNAPVRINAALNLYRMPEEEVDDIGSLVFDAAGAIDVPVGSQRIEARTCILDRDVQLALVSTHTHEWGDCATLHRYDAGADAVEGAPFYVNKDWEVPPILHFPRDTMPIAAGDGVHYACHYRNTADYALTNTGDSLGEMCVLGAVAYPADISKEQIHEVVETLDLLGAVELLNTVLTSCDRQLGVDEVPGPWVDMAAAPHFGDRVETCAGLSQTESNELE